MLELVPLSIWDSFLGFLHAIMTPIYWAMSGTITGFHWLYSQVMDPHSGWTWALSIVSLTVVVRTLMIPLFVRQINSSRKMQLVAPKARAVQEKWAHDRERQGQEIMKLYREEGVNPAASCLPLLLQMPIFIGLFTVLNNASRGIATGYFFEREPALIESLRHARFLGAEISGMLMQPGQPLTFGPTFWVAAFLIISMTATLFITQLQLLRKNMPPEALTGPMAQQQKMMLYLFPVIYLITGVSIPIGVMIYWLASNIWTLAQQYILIHNNPTPNTPAYVDWQERMRAKGKDPDEIIRKRLGQARPARQPVADDEAGTTVVRQGRNRPTSAPAQSVDTASAGGSAPQRVQRQQPTRQTRANRKQARPRQGGGTTKE